MNNETFGSQRKTNEVYTQNGLLFRDKIMIDLPEADRVAQDNGFMYAEQLVSHLEKLGKTHQPRHIVGQDDNPVT